MKFGRILLALTVFTLFPGARARAQEEPKVVQRGQGLHGYIGYSGSKPPKGSDYGAGIGFYAAVWKLVDRPIANFQIGLPSAWITPDNSDNVDRPLAPVGTLARDNWPERGPTYDSVFQTVEGGLGYWARSRFRYGPPKFSMNGTPQCYDYEVGSPGWSFFYSSEALPDDRLGIAQLSNRLLIPPDALPFSGDPHGELLGYSYMALPLTDPVEGKPPTGDQSWTCFLNASNFKGPIAYYIPETWSKIGKIFDYPLVYGRGLDARAGRAGGGAMEINTVPRFEAKDRNGVVYAKIPKLRFPVDADGRSRLVQDVTHYSKAALYDAVKAWRLGGPVAPGRFAASGAFKSKLKASPLRFDQGGQKLTGVNAVFDTVVDDGNVWGLTWHDNTLSPRGTFPQYSKQVGNERVAISVDDVPKETGLLEREFALARAGEPFTSPASGAWTTPGPVRGPFTRELADGSLVTYSWYRFVDQPSFQQYAWPEAKKAQLQAFVEKVHATWKIDGEYMAPPTTGTLATLDPALLVTPPKGLEVGYVPIVTRQEQAPPAPKDAPAPRRAQPAKDEAKSPRIVNIINFIRQCEPRIEWITEDVLYETVVQQIEVMKRHGFPGTFLLQYDALIDPRYQELLTALPKEQFEVGAWWEIPEPLVKDSGLKWRGRYPWDWHADVGFATGYSPDERERLIDTYMAAFKKVFGRYPKSVGSWFIDAHTLQYLYDRYAIVASCNCKDQIGTDGYTLWGGYWNQGYYPSKKNAYMPAQNAANQIPVPIFRMLGSDPIHQYDSGLGQDHQPVISLEPIYNPGGANSAWCQWYFDAFIEGEAMDYAYTQVGQENSFTWKRMGKGFTMQMELLARLRNENKITLQTLAVTGAWFKQRYPVTPPTSVTVLNDYSKKQQKTVWFNSRFYRANLLWDQGTLRFRDIHLFDEQVASDYLTQRGTSTRCDFYALPLVDGFRWSTQDTIAGLRLKSLDDGKEITGGTPTVKKLTDATLTVTWPTESPRGELVFTFEESALTITASGDLKNQWLLELSSAPNANLPFDAVTPNTLACTYKHARYAIAAEQGTFEKSPLNPLRIRPQEQRIVLNFTKR